MKPSQLRQHPHLRRLIKKRIHYLLVLIALIVVLQNIAVEEQRLMSAFLAASEGEKDTSPRFSADNSTFVYDNLNFVYDYLQNHSQVQKQMQREASTTQLWLYPYRFREGLSSWKFALADVMQLAKQLDAVIVIPDILDGALLKPGSGNLHLFELFDKSHIDSYYSKWVTEDDFHRKTRTNTNTIHWDIGKANKTKGTLLPRDYQNQLIQPLKEALNLINPSSGMNKTYDNVVLNMTHIWKWQFHNVQLRDKNQKEHPLVSREESESVIAKKHLVFSNWIHNLTDQTLALMNVSTHFGLVHWRADQENLDYQQCSDHLVRARQALIESKRTKSVHEDTPFILMSSLKVDTNLMWSSMKGKVLTGKAASPAEALQFLTNRPSNRTGSQSGYFLMTESVLPRQKDQIVYAAIDILLVQRATVFATCTSSCNNGSRKYAPFADVCNACNYLGMFAASAVKMRQDLSAASKSSTDATTLTCWPHNASDVEVLSV